MRSLKPRGRRRWAWTKVRIIREPNQNGDQEVPKPTTRFVCQSCGAVAPRWAGRCETCGEWNTFTEETIEAGPGLAKAPAKPGTAKRIEFVPLAGEAEPPPRVPVGLL